MEIPLNDTLMGRIRRLFNLDRDESHISVPSEGELLEILERQGLRILEKRYFLHSPQGRPGIPPAISSLLGIRIFHNLELVLQKP